MKRNKEEFLFAAVILFLAATTVLIGFTCSDTLIEYLISLGEPTYVK